MGRKSNTDKQAVEPDAQIVAAVYLRKSVKGTKRKGKNGKDDESLSLASQKRDCLALIKRNKWTLGGIYEEAEGTSGSAIGNRSEFVRLCEDIDARRYQIVVARDPDRIARSEDLPKTIKRWKHRGVRTVCVDKFDSDANSAEMEADFRAAMSNQQRKSTALSVHATLKMKATDGENPGLHPYGYKRDLAVDKKRGKVINNGLVKDPETAPVVLRIFELYADGKSPHMIAAILNAEGIPSPRGGTWDATTISCNPKRQLGIINNSIYVGEPKWNRSKSSKDPDTGIISYTPRPESEWVKMPKDKKRYAIVTDALWKKVRDRQKTRMRSKQGRTISEALAKLPKRVGGKDSRYFLGGILKCGVCGSNLIGDGRVDYVCNTYTNGGCQNDRRIRRDTVHDAVFGIVQSHLSNPAVIDAGLNYVKSVLRAQVAEQDAARRAAANGTRFKHIDKQIDALRKLNLPPTAYSAAVAALEQDREALLELPTTRVDDRAKRLLERLPEIYEERCKAIRAGIGALTDQDSLRRAREAVRTLLVDEQIVLHPDDGTGMRGTVEFVELGAQELGLDGTKRPVRFIGRGDRI